LVAASRTAAQRNPFSGPDQFPQFRNLSGLAGGGYGVDAGGNGSLAGATAYSTPIGYVLGHDQFRIGIAKLSYDSGPNWDNGHSNGKGIITFGHSFGQFNFTFTDLFKSLVLDQAYNLQIAYQPSTSAVLVPSIGVQDLLGHGGSAGIGNPTDNAISRSIFGVLTWRIDLPRRPLFLSAGGGNHRFSKGFASTSYQVAGPLRGWLEYDGWGFNEGFLLTYRTRVASKPMEFNADLGLVRGRYLAIAGVIGF
jgi:hypothetical protein